MTIIKPNILIIADREDIKHLDPTKESDYWTIFWEIIDYNRLHKSIEVIRELIEINKIDFILYSSNDQVSRKLSIGPITKKLEIGYSSFSGIDEIYRVKEMKNCFCDFMRCNNRLDSKTPLIKKMASANSDCKGSFSLLFDTEQIGCVRYALPRILKLLAMYNVKATFFITNLMKTIYSNIVEDLTSQGHEIGLHGRWHEYLSKYSKKDQTELIKEMVNDFGLRVYGANFIGRMNEDTIHGLIENQIKYFVFPAINCFRFLCYPKLPTNPYLISTEKGKIWMLPISVETYGNPWSSIRNMIDSAYLESLKSNHHITILCHPFRDGNLQNIEITEKLIRYLIINKKLKSVVAKDLPIEREKAIDISQIGNISLKLGIRDLIPQTKQDYISIMPQNCIMIYKMIRRNYTVW